MINIWEVFGLKTWACQFTHPMSNFGTAVAFDNTSGSRCRAAAARIRQRSEETLPFADWLIQDGGFVRKFVILCHLIFIPSPNEMKMLLSFALQCMLPLYMS